VWHVSVGSRDHKVPARERHADTDSCHNGAAMKNARKEKNAHEKNDKTVCGNFEPMNS